MLSVCDIAISQYLGNTKESARRLRSVNLRCRLKFADAHQNAMNKTKSQGRKSYGTISLHGKDGQANEG